jgi:hypothetical protein
MRLSLCMRCDAILILDPWGQWMCPWCELGTRRPLQAISRAEVAQATAEYLGRGGVITRQPDGPAFPVPAIRLNDNINERPGGIPLVLWEDVIAPRPQDPESDAEEPGRPEQAGEDAFMLQGAGEGPEVITPLDVGSGS